MLIGVNYGAKLIYGYKLESKDIKAPVDIPKGIQAKTGYDYPGARDCFEHLYSKYREQDFTHFETDAIGGNGVLVVGVSIARARSSNTTPVEEEKLENAKNKLTSELDQDISKIAETEDREPQIILTSTIG